MATPTKLFVLKPTTPNLIINKFKNLNEKDQAIINSKQISLPVSRQHSSATQKFFGPETFQHIHSWHLSELCCFKKLYPQILQDLSHINFNFLLRLNLSKCYIQSIQSIAWLNSPNIEQICLDDNDIRSIKPLAKLNLKQLQILSVSNNFFEHDQLSYLTRVKLQQDKVVHLKVSKSFKKRTNCIETVFKIQARKKINTSILFTEINNKSQLEKLLDIFPNSITSMTENQFWMFDQLQMQMIKQTPRRNQVQSHSYFQKLNI